MTKHLTKEQLKMLTPKARKQVAFDARWAKAHHITLMVMTDKKEGWCKLRQFIWGDEREYRKMRKELDRQLQGWIHQGYFGADAKFQIIDTHTEEND